MFKNFLNLIVGDLGEKRQYKQMMKRVKALPKEYSFAFKKIQKYMYTVGCSTENMNILSDPSILLDLVELFEISAAEGRSVMEVIGSDVSKFCNEFMLAYTEDTETLGEKLNRAIMEKFNQESVCG